MLKVGRPGQSGALMASDISWSNKQEALVELFTFGQVQDAASLRQPALTLTHGRRKTETIEQCLGAPEADFPEVPGKRLFEHRSIPSSQRGLRLLI